MKNIKILIFLSIFSLVTYFWFSNKDNFLMSNIDSKQGIYEFTEWNEDELYRLKGEWEFYPKQFIDENQSDFDSKQYQTVDHLWTQDPNFNHGFGYASYRLNISGLDPNKQYGLLLEEAGSSYGLYVNGRLILSNGKVSNNIENAINSKSSSSSNQSKDYVQNIRDSYANQMPELVNADVVEKIIKEKELEIEEFVSEVDFVLSEVNATTKIKVPLSL